MTTLERTSHMCPLIAATFDEIAIKEPGMVREFMPQILETDWFWQRGTSFTSNLLEAMQLSHVQIGQEKVFIEKYEEVIARNLKPKLDKSIFDTIEEEGLLAIKLTHVIGIIRKHEAFFKQLNLGIPPDEDKRNYPYIPDDIMRMGIIDSGSFIKLPQLKGVAPTLLKFFSRGNIEFNINTIKRLLKSRHPDEALFIMREIQQREFEFASDA